MFDDIFDDLEKEIKSQAKSALKEDTYSVECPHCKKQISVTPGKSKCPKCKNIIELKVNFDW